MAKSRKPRRPASTETASTPTLGSAPMPARSETPAASHGADEPARKRRGPKPGTDAARRGGIAARNRYGSAFYSRIGKQGGEAVRKRRGSAFYSEIGRRGGESTKRTHGLEHYARIGHIGGTRRGKNPPEEAGGGTGSATTSPAT